MARVVIRGETIGQALQAVGLVPQRCRSVSLQLGAGEAALLRYDVLLQPADLRLLASALLIVAEDADRAEARMGSPT